MKKLAVSAVIATAFALGVASPAAAQDKAGAEPQARDSRAAKPAKSKIKKAGKKSTKTKARKPAKKDAQ